MCSAFYPLIAGAGLASLFGGTVLALPFLFDLLRMPADLFQVFVTMDVIAVRFGTLAAGMHIIALALIGSYAMQGRLRVCYRGSDYPSAFFNTSDELVGFDIELTHRFAQHLSTSIDFLPVKSSADAARRLDAGGCDLFMSLLPIAPETTLGFTLTEPVLEGAVGLLVEDWRRREFRTWRGIRALDAPRWSIGRDVLGWWD